MDDEGANIITKLSRYVAAHESRMKMVIVMNIQMGVHKYMSVRGSKKQQDVRWYELINKCKQGGCKMMIYGVLGSF
eukprot:10774216-Karenia_brevis.AAC.1